MSKDYLHKFRRKIDINGCSQSSSETIELRENFNEMVDQKLAPTVHTVKYVKKENVGTDLEGTKININIENVAYNDQKTNDEKFVNFKWDSNVKIGDEFYWHDTWWVLYHEEKLSIFSHKTYVCKKCNFIYNMKFNGEVYQIPLLLTNLTLYSDGMADRVAMSAEEGGRRITYPVNDLTKNLVIGSRIMLSNDTIYEIAHMDDFSRVGVVDAVLNQIFFNSQDDKENVIAWNDFNEKNEASILGDEVLRLGANAVYTNPFNLSALPIWEIDAEDNCVWIDTTYDNSSNGNVRLQCTKDMSYIGTTVTLRVTNRRTNIVCVKTIKIGGMF
jgi:hypothetical protein